MNAKHYGINLKKTSANLKDLIWFRCNWTNSLLEIKNNSNSRTKKSK